MEELIEELRAIIEDDTIPKNVKLKIESAIAALSEESIEESLRANKALQELDDLSDDPNIPSYIRPQLWNILSQLETR
ncbi:MAG TPA: hypothetical protein HA360_04485 [Nanoarchaeota archaeon]|nr:UPF0147 family protein [Candidatus Woesearchaeota archaeon]HIH15135.1 hypothetical protein [Nanoarchaeota archaeon]HIH59402.1 hypothetical protein [Nanoarchaeota archaeon]HII14305.1 hypothetical protein [Nanoarchaeota archaeon]HIJ04607.1 hypothetical protein [Nanoarchaeota archaeon]